MRPLISGVLLSALVLVPVPVHAAGQCDRPPSISSPLWNQMSADAQMATCRVFDGVSIRPSDAITKPANWNSLNAREQAEWLASGRGPTDAAFAESMSGGSTWRAMPITQRSKPRDWNELNAREQAEWLATGRVRLPQAQSYEITSGIGVSQCGRRCGESWTAADFAESARLIAELERSIAALEQARNAPVYFSRVGNDSMIYPTIPGTSIRDYSRPGFKVEGENIYPTLPGTSVRDYSKPGFKVDGDSVYPTLPGTSVRDYSRPGTKSVGDDIYPTLPGTSVRDYSRPGARVDGNHIFPTLPGTSIRDYSQPGSVIIGDMVYPTLPGTSIRDYSRPGTRIR